MLLFTWLTLLGLEEFEVKQFERYEAALLGTIFTVLGVLMLALKHEHCRPGYFFFGGSVNLMTGSAGVADFSSGRGERCSAQIGGGGAGGHGGRDGRKGRCIRGDGREAFFDEIGGLEVAGAALVDLTVFAERAHDDDDNAAAVALGGGAEAVTGALV